MKTRHRPGRTLPIILAACVLVSGGAGAAAGLFLGKRPAGAEAKDEHDKKKRHKKVEPAVIYSLGEMVVNLADTDTMRYIKVTVALGIEEKIPEEHLKEFTPALRDSVVTVLTGKKFDELHRPDGIPKVKELIRATVEDQVHEVTVVEVYFEGFAMQ
jgi:flagellar FliL protein